MCVAQICIPILARFRVKSGRIQIDTGTLLDNEPTLFIFKTNILLFYDDGTHGNHIGVTSLQARKLGKKEASLLANIYLDNIRNFTRKLAKKEASLLVLANIYPDNISSLPHIARKDWNHF